MRATAPAAPAPTDTQGAAPAPRDISDIDEGIVEAKDQRRPNEFASAPIPFPVSYSILDSPALIAITPAHWLEYSQYSPRPLPAKSIKFNETTGCYESEDNSIENFEPYVLSVLASLGENFASAKRMSNRDTVLLQIRCANTLNLKYELSYELDSTSECAGVKICPISKNCFIALIKINSIAGGVEFVMNLVDSSTSHTPQIIEQIYPTADSPEINMEIMRVAHNRVIIFQFAGETLHGSRLIEIDPTKTDKWLTTKLCTIPPGDNPFQRVPATPGSTGIGFATRGRSLFEYNCDGKEKPKILIPAGDIPNLMDPIENSLYCIRSFITSAGMPGTTAVKHNLTTGKITDYQLTHAQSILCDPAGEVYAKTGESLVFLHSARHYPVLKKELDASLPTFPSVVNDLVIQCAGYWPGMFRKMPVAAPPAPASNPGNNRKCIIC